MGLFKSGMNKPRRFNHQYIYYDERKEKLDKRVEDNKRELGMIPEKEVTPEDIRGKFVEGTKHLKRRKDSGRKPLNVGIIILVIVLRGYLGECLRNDTGLF